MSRFSRPPSEPYSDDVTDEIRQIIRECIEGTGESQAEVARRMGLKPQELNRALQERGKIPPVWATILAYFNLELSVKQKKD